MLLCDVFDCPLKYTLNKTEILLHISITVNFQHLEQHFKHNGWWTAIERMGAWIMGGRTDEWKDG